MSLLSHTRNDGIAAGKAILELLTEIEPSLKDCSGELLLGEDLESIFKEIERRTPAYGEHCGCLEGLLSQLLKPHELDSDLITLWGADQLWSNQENYAPVCEIDSSLGFIQFGNWCGQTDGEAWIYDTERAIIGTLSAGLLEYTADYVRSSFEVKFHSPWQFASFLRCDAWERGWVKTKNLG